MHDPKIWFVSVTLDELNQRGKKTLVEHLGIRFTELGSDFLAATMPVDHRTKQPLGLLHGGASVALAETIGSTAANLCVNPETHYCVGLEINANHVRSASSGIVTGKTTPVHLGKKTHVWEIKICDRAGGKLISICRLTMAVLSKEKHQE